MALQKPWILVRNVTSGGQGDLFEVRRPDDPGLYALKRLKNPKRAKRFLREIRATQDLYESCGPVFPQIIESGTDDRGRPYYVMPWLAGSLQAEVDAHRFGDRIPEGLARLAELGELLGLLHSRNWAHRDLKPANVLVDHEGSLVLADLGLAIELPEERAEEQERITPSFEAVGSRYYMAPENEDGASDDHDPRRADFYAFAKIIWVVLLGRRPLSREHQLEASNRLANVLADQRLAALDQLCEQLLLRDPNARLADWGTVSEELLAVAASLTDDASAGRPSQASPIDAAKAAAHAFRNSPERFARDEQREREDRRIQAFRTLEEAVWASAQAMGPEASAVTEAFEGDFQIFMGKRGVPSQRDVVGWLRGTGHSLTALELSLADRLYERGPLLECGLDCLFDPSFPSVHLAGLVLPDGDRIWTVRVPLWSRRDGPGNGVIVGLLDRFMEVSGPFRLGLESTVEAARRLGDSVCITGVSITPEYIDHVRAGRDILAPDTWRPREEKLSPSERED